eukprot:PhM_4_TR12724/c1_g1_i1/m.33513
MQPSQFSPTGSHLLKVVPGSGTLEVWSTSSHEHTTFSINTPSVVVTSWTWAADGNEVVAGTSDGCVVGWELGTRAQKYRVKVAGSADRGDKAIVSLSSVTSGLYVLTHNTLSYVDPSAGADLKVTVIESKLNGKARTVVASANGTHFALSTEDTVMLYEIDTQLASGEARRIQRYKGQHSAAPSAVALVESKGLLSVVTADATHPSIMLWSSTQKRCVCSVSSTDPAASLATRGALLLSVHNGPFLRLWKLQSEGTGLAHVRDIAIPGVLSAATFLTKDTIVAVSLTGPMPQFHHIDVNTAPSQLPVVVRTAPKPKTDDDEDGEGDLEDDHAAAAEEEKAAKPTTIYGSALPRVDLPPEATSTAEAVSLEPTAQVSGGNITMARMLLQALRTSDTAALREVMYKTDLAAVEATVAVIPQPHAVMFLRVCTEEFTETSLQKTETHRKVLAWLRAVIRRHGTYIRSLPYAHSALAPLRGVLGEFTQHLPVLENFATRLKIMCDISEQHEFDNMRAAELQSGGSMYATQRFRLGDDGSVTKL